MNKKSLILTSTVGMTRQDWLAFRQPMTHVKKFVLEWVCTKLARKVSEDAFFRRHPATVKMLKECFASKEWKEFTFPCIGASEISPLLGLNPWYSKIELFFEKVGIKPFSDEDNEAMFWGRELEEEICEKWQYWEGSPESMIANFNAKQIKKRCRRINAYAQNKAFPWIFVSLDRVINKQRNGEETMNEGSLEGKTIVGFVSKMWEGGIPPMYVAQLQTQLGVFEFEFGEIAILKDGRYFEVIPFDKHQGIIDRLIRESKSFFISVKYSIERWLLHQSSTNEADQQRWYAEIEQVSPDPDGSDSYKNYLSEKYKDSILGQEIVGTVVEEELAQQYRYIDARLKDLNYMKTECRNRLTAYMKEIPTLKLDDLGKVTWKEEGRKNRVFRVNIQVDPQYIPEAFRTDPGLVAEQIVLNQVKIERKEKKKKPAKEPVKKPDKKVPKKPVKIPVQKEIKFSAKKIAASKQSKKKK